MKADPWPPTQAAKLALAVGVLVVILVVGLCLYWRGLSVFTQVVELAAALAGWFHPPH
jgi:hypothetical protein